MLFVVTYRIAQNSGGGKYWRIWRIKCNSPIFYPPMFSTSNTIKIYYIGAYRLLIPRGVLTCLFTKYLKKVADKDKTKILLTIPSTVNSHAKVIHVSGIDDFRRLA